MTTTRFAMVAMLAACSGARTGPTDRGRPPTDLPAASWATEVPPFRLPANAAGAMWVDEERAVVGLSTGWLAAVDLVTGAVTSKKTDGILGDTDAITRLADGRLVVLISRDDRLRFYEVGDDLGLTLLREDGDEGWEATSIAVAASGRSAIAGERHPLEVREPSDAISVLPAFPSGTLDPGWSALHFADGDRRLLGRHNGSVTILDLVTGDANELGAGTWRGASTGTRALAELDGTLAVIDVTTGAVVAELTGKPTGHAAMSRDGTRAARFEDAFVLVHDTTSRSVVARFSLESPGATYTGWIAFTPSGRRVVLTTGPIVRVVDLAAGTISPLGPGPFRSPTFLAVTRDHVIAGADRVRRWPVGGGPSETIGPDDPDTSDGAVSPSGQLVVATRKLSDESAATQTELTVWRNATTPTETARWTRRDSIASVALGDDGAVLVGAWRRAEDGAPGQNVIEVGRARGGWNRLIEVHYDGYVDTIDATTRLAALSRSGAVRLIQLPGSSPISTANIPSCDGSGNVHLDGAGRRIATDDDKSVWIWDVSKRTGKKLASGGFSGRVGEVVFVPDRTELVMDLDDRVGVWDYKAGRAVSTPVNGIIGKVSIDAAATRVAIGMTNGRILVLPLAELRLGAAEPIAASAPDQTCDADPLDAPGERRFDEGD